VSPPPPAAKQRHDAIEHLLEFLEPGRVTLIRHRLDFRRRPGGRPAVEGRLRIVLDSELDCLRALRLRRDTGGDAATGERVAVADHTLLHRDRADAREEMMVGAVRRGALPPEEARRAEDERAGWICPKRRQLAGESEEMQR
jgi:hypothetical protein